MPGHIVITGGAGFIGSHLVDRLLAEGGWRVTVVDNFDPFYPRVAKERNIAAHRTIWRGTMSFTLDPIGMSLYSPPPYVASVAELADALDSGSSG